MGNEAPNGGRGAPVTGFSGEDGGMDCVRRKACKGASMRKLAHMHAQGEPLVSARLQHGGQVAQRACACI